MQWLSKALTKGPDLKADILDAGTEIKGSKLPWKLHEAKRKDTGAPASALTFEITSSTTDIEILAARNALRRLKTTRHPHVLLYLDGAEPPEGSKSGKFIIIVEHVKPLEQILATASAQDKESWAWGLWGIAQAMNFVNSDCHMLHGNLCVPSIFVSQGGDWKLGGFELASDAADRDGGLFRRADALRVARVMPPEVARGQWAAVGAAGPAPHAVDAWCYGCLVREVHAGELSRPEDLKDTAPIPPALLPTYKSTLKGAPEQRPAGAAIAAAAYFEVEAVALNQELAELALKTAAEKEAFLVRLAAALDTLPDQQLRYKILPELLKALEFGGAGTAAMGPLLRIGQRMSADEFAREIVPSVVRCFASTDRGTRIALLQNLHTFAHHLTPALVERDIYPQVATGFTDSVPALRELTAKSLVYLVPKLSEKVINSQVLRAIAGLQQDTEGSIRCNTTICLAKIAPLLPAATRDKVLLPSFTRALSDPFPPARMAGLMALSVTLDHVSPSDLARRVIPAAAALALDGEAGVRQQAVACLKAGVNRLEVEAGRLGEELAVAHGTSVVTAPTVSDSGVLGWAANAATKALEQKIWPSAAGGATAAGDTPAAAATAAPAAAPKPADGRPASAAAAKPSAPPPGGKPAPAATTTATSPPAVGGGQRAPRRGG